ncbi:MAG: hypothetical protein ACK5LV_01600 [Lachnospirales bacterium]
MMNEFDDKLNMVSNLFENCERAVFSKSKIVFNEETYEEIRELLGDLIETYPNVVQSTRDILKRKDDIIRHAKEEAKYEMEQAERRAEFLVSESEIHKRAMEQISFDVEKHENIIDDYYEEMFAYVDNKMAEVDKHVRDYINEIVEQATKTQEESAKASEIFEEQTADVLHQLSEISEDIYEKRAQFRKQD